jgi:hypothetical protein
MAIAQETGVNSAAYALCVGAQEKGPKVNSPEGDVFLLSLPPNVDNDAVIDLVSGIMNRRPELAQYAGLLVARGAGEVEGQELR